MMAIVRKQQKRKEVGKETVFRVRGYEIDEARISRFIARTAKQEIASTLPGSPEDFGSGK
jgi:molybdopterin biosynthesis enzyme MoaB